MTDDERAELDDLRMASEVLMRTCKAFGLALLGKQLERMERERLDDKKRIASLEKRLDDMVLRMREMEASNEERMQSVRRAYKELKDERQATT